MTDTQPMTLDDIVKNPEEAARRIIKDAGQLELHDAAANNAEKWMKVQPQFDKLTKNEKGGVKADTGKLEWSLLPYDALIPVVKILMLGARKYSADNWRKVERTRYVDAALRHLTAFMMGEAIDPESGLPHIAHAACNLLFLTALYGDDPFDIMEKVK